MIKLAVAKVVKLSRSKHPYEIADAMNILKVFEPLGEIYGYCNSYRRMKMVHINENINEQSQIFTCAHEIGHIILHPGINVPFLSKHTLMSKDKIERQANQFAVELLIPDKLLLDGATIYEAATICGVPQEVAHLKKLPRKLIFWSDESTYLNL